MGSRIGSNACSSSWSFRNANTWPSSAFKAFAFGMTDELSPHGSMGGGDGIKISSLDSDTVVESLELLNENDESSRVRSMTVGSIHALY